MTSAFTVGCNASKLGLSLTLLPIGFYQFPLVGLGDCLPLPQAWTLGLELTFYIFAPFIILSSNLPRWAALGSIGIFLLAYAGVLNTDNYGYRLLPGTLFIFLAGSAFAAPLSLGRKFPWLVWIGAALLYGLAYVDRTLLTAPYNKEVLVGMLVGIPVLALLKDWRFSALDEFLGNLSYGIFLNHFSCIWVMQKLGFNLNRIGPFVLLLAVSASFSLASYYVIEFPALKWRRKLRNRPATSVATA